MSNAEPVAVKILDREFLIACTAEERPGLLAAANYLDAKMREVRNSARAPGMERIAVLAALNVTHELMALQQNNDSASRDVAQHVQALKFKLEGVLTASVK